MRGLVAAIHEPVGVIGIACPDDGPLLAFVSLIAPAISRGNTVVCIPSALYPLSATDLYQVFDTSDLPAGVVNIITGDRDHLVKTLVEHDDVDSLWYFGDAEGSRQSRSALDPQCQAHLGQLRSRARLAQSGARRRRRIHARIDTDQEYLGADRRLTVAVAKYWHRKIENFKRGGPTSLEAELCAIARFRQWISRIWQMPNRSDSMGLSGIEGDFCHCRA